MTERERKPGGSPFCAIGGDDTYRLLPYLFEHNELTEAADRPDLPILFNLNIGHAMPRCIMPFGTEAQVDAERQVIRFEK